VRIARGSAAQERDIIRSFRALPVDGLVAAPSADCLVDYAAASVPVIFLSAPPGPGGIPCVYSDDARGARDAVAHLLDLGHTRIAYVGARGDMTSRLRFAGYSEAMERAKVPVLPKYIRQRESTREWGYYAAESLFPPQAPPTAVFCSSDTLAAGVIRYLASAGIAVPGNVSVVGFGDSEAARDLGLSSVSRPLGSVAEEAWHNLKLEMDGKTVPAESRIAATLVVRNSTAPPPVPVPAARSAKY
jgi:LacI family transcriptional regulator